MPVVKAIFTFEMPGKGWSETHFRNITSSTPLLDTMPFAIALANKRALLMGEQTTLKAIRLSENNVAGDGYSKIINQGAIFGAGESDQSNLSIDVIERDSTFTNWSHTYLRGCWRAWIAAGGVLQVGDANLIAAFNSFKSQLIADGWGWMSRSSKRIADITNWVAVGPGLLAFTLSVPIVAQPPSTPPRPGEVFSNTPVRISKAVASPNLNGPVVCYFDTASHCVSEKPLLAQPFGGHPKMTYNVTDFRLYANVELNGVSSRASGRPLGEQAGRAKARARG